MSKDRLIQSISLTANCVTILGLLLVIVQLQENRTLMRAQVRHELLRSNALLVTGTGRLTVERAANFGWNLGFNRSLPISARSVRRGRVFTAEGGVEGNIREFR